MSHSNAQSQPRPLLPAMQRERAAARLQSVRCDGHESAVRPLSGVAPVGAVGVLHGGRECLGASSAAAVSIHNGIQALEEALRNIVTSPLREWPRAPLPTVDRLRYGVVPAPREAGVPARQAASKSVISRFARALAMEASQVTGRAARRRCTEGPGPARWSGRLGSSRCWSSTTSFSRRELPGCAAPRRRSSRPFRSQRRERDRRGKGRAPRASMTSTVLRLILTAAIATAAIAPAAAHAQPVSSGSSGGSGGKSCTTEDGGTVEDGYVSTWKTKYTRGSTTCTNGTMCTSRGVLQGDNKTRVWFYECRDENGATSRTIKRCTTKLGVAHCRVVSRVVSGITGRWSAPPPARASRALLPPRRRPARPPLLRPRAARRRRCRRAASAASAASPSLSRRADLGPAPPRRLASAQLEARHRFELRQRGTVEVKAETRPRRGGRLAVHRLRPMPAWKDFRPPTFQGTTPRRART